ncbi:MAG: type II toxin-antitoxin system VapC family toxin [Deltaproteobacteria bacterium]|nr:type II toxin-antitoxin system VapC family toxin [Deltaproteobacteria bacterium]
MTVRWLLDTNVLSEPARERPSLAVLYRWDEHEGRVVTAAPVVHEMRYGCARLPRSRKRDEYRGYLENEILPFVPVLSYDLAAAEWHAEQRARLVRQGKTPSFVDGQIAAIAAVNDCVLVTRNTHDFQEFQGLTVEDWFSTES